MNRSFTCVLCPRGCHLELEYDSESRKITGITGAGCSRGEPWAQQELSAPMRTLCTSIRVSGGEDPLVSVKSDCDIPLERFPDVMKCIEAAVAEAPVHIGDVLLHHPAGTSCKIIATRRNHEYRKD